MRWNMQVNIKAEKTGASVRPVRHQLLDKHGAPASPMGPVGAAILVGVVLLLFAALHFAGRSSTHRDGQQHDREQQPASQLHP